MSNDRPGAHTSGGQVNQEQQAEQWAARAVYGTEAGSEPLALAQRLQKLLAYSSDHLVLMNAQRQIFYANAVEPLLGYALPEYIDFAPDTLLHPDDRPKAQAFFQQVLAVPQQTHRLEVRSRHHAGHYVWLEVKATNLLTDPDLQGIVVTSHDITPRKQAEEALQLSEARYRRAFELGLIGMALTAPNKGIVEVNDELCRILGYKREELLTMTWSALTHPDDLVTDLAQFNQVLAGEREGYVLDKRFIRKDGQVVDTTISVNCLRAADGAVDYFMALLQDITARKQAEGAERQQRQLAEALRDSLAALTSSLEVERVLYQILDSAAKVVPSEAGSIILFEGEVGRVAYLRGFPTADVAALQDYRFPLNTLPYGNVRTTRQPYCVSDTQAVSGWVSVSNSAWIRSSLGVPIQLWGEVIGVLVVDSATPDYFQPADIENLQVFAQYASLALENAHHVTRLEQRVGERTAELKAAKEQVETILNNSLDGILLVHPDLRIQQTNAAFQTLFACAPGAYVRQPLYDLIHKDDVPRVQGVIQTALQEHTGQQVEICCCRSNGTQFEAELSLGYSPATARSTEGLVCTLRDITERKRTQNVLAEERNLLRTLIDALPDYIYVKDTEHRTLLTNVAGARSFGATPAEIVGKDNFAFVPPELARQYHTDEERLFQSGLPLINHEERTLGPDGQVIWGATTKVPLRNLNGELIGLVGITRDISERKAWERQLQFHASLQENVSDAVIATDLEFRIRSWNRAAETIYGWSATEVLSKHIAECLVTQYADPAESDAHARQVLLEQGQWQGEIVQSRKDGTVLAMLSAVTLLKDEQGQPFGIVAINHNITERKQAAEALRAQRDFLQLVINHVPDLIMVKDADGRFQLVNTAVADLYGLTPTAMVGLTDATLHVNAAELAYFRQKEQETLAGRQTVFVPEEVIGGRYYQTSKIPLQNATGQYDHLLVVAADITVRKQAEEALQQALQKEKELGELKSRFLSTASHEFRTPLTVILLQAETLRTYRHKLTDDQIEQRFGKIRAQVQDLTAIMEDVLQLAKLQAHRAVFNPVPLDLDAFCQSVLEELQSQAEGAARLLYTCEANLGTVQVDKKLMQQILTNLVTNALKYSPVEKPILIRLASSGENLSLTVQDQGIGIPAADLTHIFEPFHRATNVSTIAGTGLGLAIVKEAVDRHGGTISLVSQVGRGTTFTVNLPVTQCGEKALDENSRY